MNKRSLIRIAAVGLVLGVALFSAFPSLVDALKLTRAQAATIPADEHQGSKKPSFVFPGASLTPSNSSTDAGQVDRAESPSRAAKGRYAATVDAKTDQKVSEPTSRLSGVQTELISPPALPTRNSSQRRFVFPVTRNVSVDSSASVPSNDRTATSAAVESNDDGVRTDRNFVRPPMELQSGVLSDPSLELEGLLISAEHSNHPAAAEAKMDMRVNQRIFNRRAPSTPSVVLPGTRAEAAVLSDMESDNSEPIQSNFPVLPFSSEDSSSATTPERQYEQPALEPPLPELLRSRNHSGDRSNSPLPSLGAGQQNRRPLAVTAGNPALRPPQSVPARRTKPDNDQIRFPWENGGTPDRRVPFVAQTQPNRPNVGPSGAASNQPSRLNTPQELPSPIDAQSSDNSAQGRSSNNEDEQTLGEAPEETNDALQFIRRQSILLDPGEYQFDLTFQYLLGESDFTLAQVQGNLINIGEARRRSRLILIPIEFRLGITPVTQLSVNVPFGWSNGEFIFSGEDSFDNTGGIGDVNVALTRMIIEGTEHFPDVLAILGFSAPTGDADFSTSLAVPGSSLGEGFWTATAGLTFIQTYDPIVFFYGFGYRHRFENSFSTDSAAIGDVRVNPGKQIFYRFGAGFAVNPRVTFSAAFNASYITEDYVNGIRLGGSIREPMSIRLAATIGRAKKGRGHKSVKTVEPFVAFGLTEDANDVVFGISWTR